MLNKGQSQRKLLTCLFFFVEVSHPIEFAPSEFAANVSSSPPLFTLVFTLKKRETVSVFSLKSNNTRVRVCLTPIVLNLRLTSRYNKIE